MFLVGFFICSSSLRVTFSLSYFFEQIDVAWTATNSWLAVSAAICLSDCACIDSRLQSVLVLRMEQFRSLPPLGMSADPAKLRFSLAILTFVCGFDLPTLCLRFSFCPFS